MGYTYLSCQHVLISRHTLTTAHYSTICHSFTQVLIELAGTSPPTEEQTHLRAAIDCYTRFDATSIPDRTATTAFSPHGSAIWYSCNFTSVTHLSLNAPLTATTTRKDAATNAPFHSTLLLRQLLPVRKPQNANSKRNSKPQTQNAPLPRSIRHATLVSSIPKWYSTSAIVL
jgi:hypothetical protein